MKIYILLVILFVFLSCETVDKNYSQGKEISLEDAQALGLEPVSPSPVTSVKMPSVEEIRAHEDEANLDNLPEDLELEGLSSVELTNTLISRSQFDLNYFQFDRSIIIYPYEQNYIYPIYTAEMRVTDIFFDGERISGKIMLGDTANWIVDRAVVGMVDHLFIKPKRYGLRTNLVIMTDKRIYYCSLLSFKNTHMVAITWQDDSVSVDLSSGERAISDTAGIIKDDSNNEIDTDYGSFSFGNIEDLNFDYEIQAPKRKQPLWTPVQVADNGRHTILVLRENLTGDMPVLFSENESGREIAQYRVHGRNYVIYGIYDAFELRAGGKRVRIERIR